MNWRAGAILGLVGFLLVCLWWLFQPEALTDPATILSRALIALVSSVLAGAYLGGRAEAVIDEAIEEREAFALHDKKSPES